MAESTSPAEPAADNDLDAAASAALVDAQQVYLLAQQRRANAANAAALARERLRARRSIYRSIRICPRCSTILRWPTTCRSNL